MSECQPFQVTEQAIIQRLLDAQTEDPKPFTYFITSLYATYPNVSNFLSVIYMAIQIPHNEGDPIQLNFSVFKNALLGLKEELHIPMRTFLKQFNQSFKYISRKPFLDRIEHNFLSSLNIDLYTVPTKEQCLQIYNDIARIGDLSPEQSDNFILRWYLYKEYNEPTQLDNARIFPIYRQAEKYLRITWLDFNDEILEALPYGSIISLLVNNYLHDWRTLVKAYDTLLFKLERIDRIYVLDHPAIGTETQFKDLLYHYANKNRYNQANDILGLMKKVAYRIDASPFTSKVSSFIRDVYEELDVVYIFVKMNELYLSKHHTLDIVDIDRVINKLHNLSFRARCLSKQVLASIVLLPNTNPIYDQRLIEIARELLGSLNTDDCKQFMDEESIISCRHDTFHYYTMVRWMQAYCKLYNDSKPNVFCTYANIVNFQDPNLIFPHRGFCSNCYLAYKNLQDVKIDSRHTRASNDYNTTNHDYRFFALILKNQLLCYRTRFADLCDINPSEKHFTQIAKQVEGRENILNAFLYSLSKERDQFGKFLRYF